MVFSSESFLFLFLPAFLGIYYLTPMAWRSAVILAGSYLFYGWWRFDYLALLVLTTIWTYWTGHLIARHLDTPRAKTWLAAGVIGCLAVLAVFKYLNFFLDSVAACSAQRLVRWASTGASVAHRDQLLRFSSRSVPDRRLSPRCRGDAELLRLRGFRRLVPAADCRPILRFKDLADQFVLGEHSVQKFADGMALFTQSAWQEGDPCGFGRAAGRSCLLDANPSLLLSWLGALAYTMQLYFDFSGYSDMALGLGLMMASTSARISTRPISRLDHRVLAALAYLAFVWLRDYLYIPLAGTGWGRGAPM